VIKPFGLVVTERAHSITSWPDSGISCDADLLVGFVEGLHEMKSGEW